MNILVCNQPFDLSTGSPVCTGQLSSVAYEGMPENSGLTWEEVQEIQGDILILFSLVFGFLVLRKLL